jgi:amino acid adenylation domain-containing protein
MSTIPDNVATLSPERTALLMLRLKQRKNEFNAFPLSFAQKRLWVIDQLDPQSAAYNIPMAVRFHGALDTGALQQALSEIVRRHEILRTTIKTIDGEPMQVISPAGPLDLDLTNLDDLPAESREAEAQRRAQTEARRPFDLARGPLMRVSLLRLAEQDHVLLLTMHHIVSDAWSAEIFVREFAALYETFSRGEPSPLSELPIQYADYAVWQRNHLQGDTLNRELDYWRSQLSDAPVLIDLPTDHPRPAVQSHRGATRSYFLDQEVLEGLQKLSRHEGVTMFMLLLAAFKALLFRYTNQTQIVVGTPIAGRRRIDTEGLMGFFVNTLALSTTVNGDESFLQLLRRVKGVCVGAYAHQELPFEKLLEELQPERSSSHSPLFQVMMSYQNKERLAVQLHGLRLSRMELEFETAKFDMVLRAIERERGLELRVAYRTDVFESTTIDQLMDHYKCLLAGITSYAEQHIARLPLLSAQEQRQLMPKQDRAAVAYERRCLHELFEEQVKLSPDEIALVYGDDELTYSELNRQANGLAHSLRSMGVGPEVMVGMLTERSLEMVVGVLGILKAGGVYIPLDPMYPADRLSFMLRDASVSLVLTQSFLSDLLPDNDSIRVVCLDGLDRSGAQREPVNLATAENAAYVIYTSGSTGQPKGVVVNHFNVTRLFATTRSYFDFTRKDTWALFHSYAFDFSVWELWGALLYGGRLVIVPYWVSRSPADFYQLLKRNQVTVLNQTPSAFRLLIAEDEVASKSDQQFGLRLVIFGGEALDIECLKPWVERHGDQQPRLINMYGITETTVHVTNGPIMAEDVVNGARSGIGVELDDLESYVLDPWQQLVPAKVCGELYLGGSGLARGYLQRAALTAERFVPHSFSTRPGERLYRTGDLARRWPDGQLHYAGRTDHQVKLRGFRIELGEIEAHLLQHPSVAQAVVMLRRDPPRDERLVAYLVLKSECEPPELRDFLKQRLPDYMVPSAFINLPALPLTPNGKLDRAKLPALPFSEREDSNTSEGQRSQTALEHMLTGLWREVLGTERLLLTANFFEAGGDSIKAAVIVNRLQQRLNRIIHVVTIFDAPTVEQYAAYLEQEYGDAVAAWQESERAIEGETGPVQMYETHKVGANGGPADGSGASLVDLVTADELQQMRRLVEQQPWRRTAKPLAQKNPPMLFILSAPRSGSTLLRVMLGGHSSLFAPPELELLGYDDLSQRREAHSGRQSFWQQGTVRALMQLRGCGREEAELEMAGYEDDGISTQEFYRLMQQAAGGSLIVDKTPSYTMDMDTLRRGEEEFEGALYLHLVRNPYGMIRSFEEAHVEQIFPRFAHPFCSRKLAEVIWTVSEQNILSFLKSVPEERQRQVEFERLVREPEQVMREVSSWLGLEYEEVMIEPYLEKQKRMTDGVNDVGKMLGDIKFLDHVGIEQHRANSWRKSFSKEFLGVETWAVAETLGYLRSNDDVQSSSNGKRSASRLEMPIVDGPSAALPPIARVTRDASNLPLSFAQERLWFLNQLEPESPFYNCPAGVRLHGQLDVEALERTLSEIVRRHDVLRTSFPLVDERPVQIVSPPSGIKFPLVDLSALSEVEREIEAGELASREARHPFNLTEGPLLRVMLLRLRENAHIVLFSTHHIVSDGWSTNVLIREVATLYCAFCKGEPSPLPELPVQYADFAVWQRGWLQGKVWEEHLDYWRRQLGGKLPVLSLPIDFDRPAEPVNRGAVEVFQLSSALTESLKKLSRQENVTLFMTLLAAFKSLLYRYTGQTDLVVGTDIANRNRVETEALIGFFINLLVLRTDLSGFPTFRQLIARVRETTVGAYRHQDMPFEKLVEELRPGRRLSAAPLLQVIFGVRNVPQDALELPGLILSALENNEWTARFDLSVSVREQSEGLMVHWKYNADIFSPFTIRTMAIHYATLLESAVAHPDACISALEMLSDSEKAQRANKKRTREEINARKFKTIKPQSVSMHARS